MENLLKRIKENINKEEVIADLVNELENINPSFENEERYFGARDGDTETQYFEYLQTEYFYFEKNITTDNKMLSFPKNTDCLFKEIIEDWIWDK